MGDARGAGGGGGPGEGAGEGLGAEAGGGDRGGAAAAAARPFPPGSSCSSRSGAGTAQPAAAAAAAAGGCGRRPPEPRRLLSTRRRPMRRRRRRRRVVRGPGRAHACRLACRGAPGRSCAPGAASGLLRSRHGLLQPSSQPRQDHSQRLPSTDASVPAAAVSLPRPTRPRELLRPAVHLPGDVPCRGSCPPAASTAGSQATAGCRLQPTPRRPPFARLAATESHPRPQPQVAARCPLQWQPFRPSGLPPPSFTPVRQRYSADYICAAGGVVPLGCSSISASPYCSFCLLAFPFSAQHPVRVRYGGSRSPPTTRFPRFQRLATQPIPLCALTSDTQASSHTEGCPAGARGLRWEGEIGHWRVTGAPWKLPFVASVTGGRGAEFSFSVGTLAECCR